MRFIIRVVLILLIFALSFVLARQYSGKWKGIDHLAFELRQFFADFIDKTGHDGAGKIDIVPLLLTELHSKVVGCDRLQQPVTDKAGIKIYRWQDEGGRWVFSDKPRESGDMEEMSLPSTGKDYFNLSVQYPAGMVPTDIKQTLEVSGRGLYRIYEKYLGAEQLSRANLEILVYGNRDAYDQLKQQMAPELASKTPGFYSGTENKAVVLHEGLGSRLNALPSTKPPMWLMPAYLALCPTGLTRGWRSILRISVFQVN